MLRFHYTAADSQGNRLSGEIEAADIAAARALLEARDLRVEQIVPLPTQNAAALSPAAAEQLVAEIADVAAVGLPLAPGLRAAAAECPRRTVATALMELADRVEQGSAIDDALATSAARLPMHIGGLITAATRSGDLGDALMDLVRQQRSAREIRRSIIATLAYPSLIVVLTLLLFIALNLTLVQEFPILFRDMEIELASATRLLLWVSDVGAWLMIAGMLSIPVFMLAGPRLLGKPRWHRTTSVVPLVGPLWHWSGVIQMADVLCMLIARDVPLPEALRLASDGLARADIGLACRRLADGVEQGQTLAQLVAREATLPASLVPLLSWGEKMGSLAEALGAVSQQFDERVRMRARLIESVLPPLVFVFVGMSVALLVSGLLLPLVEIVQKLA